MNDLLSGGAISAIFGGENPRNPVLQILACRKMDPSASNRRFPSNVDRYRLMISDGEHSCNTAMLATQLNRMVTRQEVGEKAVIRAKQYACHPVANNRRVIVILKLEVVRKGPDVGVTIGNPTPIRNSPESTGTSDVAGSSEESPSSSSLETDAGKGISQGLICPMCLEGFKNPTLLACGHTFCRVCLERFDKLHRAQTYMPCPVCRKRTKLGKFRVAGLSSNFSLKGLEDGAGGKGNASAASCSMHSDVYKDILCEVCAGVICIDCLTLKQQDHKIKEKETIEAELKKKRDAAVQKSQAKKAAIETAIAKAEQDKLDVHSHFERLKQEVKGAFEKKVKILKDMEDKLLRTLNDIQKNHDGFLEECMASPKQSLGIINRALELLAASQRGNVDLDTTRALGVQCGNLENSLPTLPEVIFSEKVKDMAEKTKFHPADENVLELGCLQGLPVNTGAGSTTG